MSRIEQFSQQFNMAVVRTVLGDIYTSQVRHDKVFVCHVDDCIAGEFNNGLGYSVSRSSGEVGS